MMELTCAAGVERLMDYLEDVLPADVRAAVDAHVTHCARCVAFIASYRAIPRILEQATVVTLPQERRQALRAFLRSQHRPGPKPD